MVTKDDHLNLLERKRINIQGVVQGVGLRPYVYGLANEFWLSGFVLKDECGVNIGVERSSLSVESFISTLIQRVPTPARVDDLTSDALPLQGDKGQSGKRVDRMAKRKATNLYSLGRMMDTFSDQDEGGNVQD